MAGALLAAVFVGGGKHQLGALRCLFACKCGGGGCGCGGGGGWTRGYTGVLGVGVGVGVAVGVYFSPVLRCDGVVRYAAATV